MGDLVPLLAIRRRSSSPPETPSIARAYTAVLESYGCGHGHVGFQRGLLDVVEVLVRSRCPPFSGGHRVIPAHRAHHGGGVDPPHQADEREGVLPSTLNSHPLVWWLVVYAFFVFPEEYCHQYPGI